MTFGRARLTRLAGLAAALQAIVLAFMIAGTHGWIVPGVKANTTDYVSFYAAGVLANEGRAPAAYDQAAHWRVEQEATAPGVGYQYFFNPPPFLLIMQPLARLPYLVSFVLFQLLTLPLWLWLGTRVAGGGGVATLCLLAVPSLWWVLGLGQNSFLSASLMAGGLLLLPRRPLVAGVAFGLLCYKPHLGLLIPVALAAAGAWGAMATAAATVAAVLGLTWALYGVATWQAFLGMAQHSLSGAIDNGRVLLAGRVDPTGAMQELGLSVAAARGVWLACLAAAVCAVAVVWRAGRGTGQYAGLDAIQDAGQNRARRVPWEERGAMLAACVVIAAPFALFYDLIMCSLAACWLVRAARQTGFLPGEGPVLALLVLANLLAAAPVVAAAHIPFGAFAGPALAVLAWRRFRYARHDSL